LCYGELYRKGSKGRCLMTADDNASLKCFGFYDIINSENLNLEKYLLWLCGIRGAVVKNAAKDV